MSQLTLQINSLEALERLIGNDTECEIAIRNRVVQDFAKKHLKSIANETTFQQEIHSFKQALQKEFDAKMEEAIATVKRYYTGGNIEKITLHPEVKAKIDTQVRENIDQRIAKEVETGIEFWAKDASIERRIKERMDYHVTQHINQEVKNRLQDLAKKLTT